MHLFFGLWFICGFLATWLLIFLTSRHEWKRRGHNTKTLYEEAVSLIVSGVMALAIALSINATVQFVKYLPDGTDLTGDGSDKNTTSKQNKNVFKNVSPGSNTFNEFSTFFTTPVTIMLGFLAILFIVKIETERLQNERRHNRKKAEDNLADTAHYGIELLLDFDALHIDFLITKDELNKKYLINIDIEKLALEPDFENLLIFQHDEQYISQELIKKLYFMSANKQLRYKYIFIDSGLVYGKNEANIVLTETLKKIYYSSMATIFAEHVKRKTTPNYSDIGDDVSKIQSLLEDVFLKTDFDIKNPKNNSIVKIFLKIEHGIRDFYDVQSGIFVQNKTTVQANKNNHLSDNKTKNISDMKNEEPISAKKVSQTVQKPYSTAEKTNVIKNDIFKTFNKRSLIIESVNDFHKMEKLLMLLYSNADRLLKKGNLLHKIMDVYKDIKESNGKRLNYRPDGYILNSGLNKCELSDFIDFYKALKKTHKNQFGQLFEKMIVGDKAELIDSKTNTLNAYKAQRCMNILIKIWRECQSYYNYFELFKNLHELKDALHSEYKTDKKPIIWILSFTDSDLLNQNEQFYQLHIEWFNNVNILDYYELLQMYFMQQKNKPSKKMYEELLGVKGVLYGIDKEGYGLFLQILFAYLRNNYIEQAEFKEYQKALNNLLIKKQNLK